MSGKDLNISAVDQSSAVDFAFGRSSLGQVLVARSHVGLCAVLLGDDRRRMAEELLAFFPSARESDAEAMQLWAAEVVAKVEQPWRELDLPLDIGGTPFQRQVWDELRRIAPGGTESYAEIARRIGAPKALRAVAGACAANILALAIPCHRVLRSNGSLSGYRWGLERKRALIDREKSGVATICRDDGRLDRPTT